MLTLPLASITHYASYGNYQASEAVTSASRPEGGLVLPSGAISMATYTASADEWLLLAPPAGADAALLKRAAAAWLDSAPPSPAASVAVVPVPTIDPVLGLAVVHRRPGATAFYCGEDQIGPAAAEIISLIAEVALPVLIAGGSQHGPPRATVVAVSHARWLHPARDTWLSPSLHPVIARLTPPVTTVYACDCQVTPDLAGTLGLLGTEQLRIRQVRDGAWPTGMRLAT
jgi:hypothetical protein